MLCCGAGDQAAGLSLTAEALCAPPCFLCPFPSLSWRQADSEGRSWWSLGPPNNITVGPVVSEPLPLFFSLGFHGLQLPQAECLLKSWENPATHVASSSGNGGSTGIMVLLQVSADLEPPGNKNPHSGMCGPWEEKTWGIVLS